MRIVFAGTPEFAAQHLQALLDAGRQIVAVYTQPDRPAGRGQKLMPSPVKQLAVQHGIAVYQPQTLRDPVAQADTVSTGADSSASMVLRDGTTLVLGANSRVNLKDFAFNSTTQEGNLLVSVLRGSMRMLTGLIGKTRPESVNITTPTSTIGILGTDFIVQVPEGDK